MKFTNFEKRMFHQAFLEAKKSDYKRFHIGCVITYKHTIIGRGRNSNKSHPMQKEYNKYRNFNNVNGEFILDAIHAEIAAINSISYTTGINVDWSKVKIFTYRICKGKNLGFGNSKPCPACMNAIKELGIKHVFYTDDDGYSYLHLDR